MNTNIKLNERIAILATLDPAAVAAGTVVTSWVSAANFHSIAALIETGVLGASATIDAKLRQATSSAGAGAKDVTGKAIVQILKAAGDNVQASIELRGEDLDAANGFSFVALSVTVGVATSIYGAQLIGANARFSSAAAYNQVAVVQVV